MLESFHRHELKHSSHVIVFVGECLECEDESSLQVFVGEEATSVLPEFDITAEKQMAHKSLSPSSLYDLINKLYESNSKLQEETSEVEDASSSEQPQE